MTRIDDINFSEFVGTGTAAILFTSPWCTACRQVGAAFESLSNQLKEQVSFGTCDISISTALASGLDVLSLPTVIIFKEGNAVKRLTGSIAENSLSAALKDSL